MTLGPATNNIPNIQEQLNDVVQFLQHGRSPAAQKSLQEQVDECNKHLEAMQKNQIKAGTNAKIMKMGHSVKCAIDVMTEIKSRGDPIKVAQASFSLFFSLADLASGTRCAVISAMCGVLSGFFTFITSQDEKESLPTQIHKIIALALERYNFSQPTQRVAEWKAEASLIIRELTNHQNHGAYQFSMTACNRLNPFLRLMDELETIIKRGVNDENSAKRSVLAMGAYVNAADSYMMILSWHLVLSRTSKADDSIRLAKKLDAMVEKAKTLFGFLSDYRFLRLYPEYDGLNHIMIFYRKDMKVFPQVENFRKRMGLPETTYTIEEAELGIRLINPNPLLKWHPKCDELAGRGDTHYIAIINYTRWPIRVLSGRAGDNPKSLRFDTTVFPNECYSHECVTATGQGWFFSSGGVMCIGQDKETITEMTDVKFLEFSLSNPMVMNIFKDITRRKILLNAVDEIPSSTPPGHKTWSSMIGGSDTGEQFKYHNVVCWAAGMIQEGRNGYCVWKFCIEEAYDDAKLEMIDEWRLKRISEWPGLVIS